LEGFVLMVDELANRDILNQSFLELETGKNASVQHKDDRASVHTPVYS